MEREEVEEDRGEVDGGRGRGSEEAEKGGERGKGREEGCGNSHVLAK